MKSRKSDAACSKGTPTNEFTSRRAYSLKRCFAHGTTGRAVCVSDVFQPGTTIPRRAVAKMKDVCSYRCGSNGR